MWEWGEDHFAALPGFAAHPYYDDFSAPCFAGLHQLVRGLGCPLRHGATRCAALHVVVACVCIML